VSDITDTVNMRAGDRYPTITGVIEDEDGNQVDLTDGDTVADVTMTIVGHPPGERIVHTVDAEVVDAPSGTVRYDWQEADTTSVMQPAVFTVSATVQWSDGRTLTAPTLQPVEVNLRPGIAEGADLLLSEDTDLLMIDPDNAFLI
jgi:hypothetical protein